MATGHTYSFIRPLPRSLGGGDKGSFLVLTGRAVGRLAGAFDATHRFDIASNAFSLFEFDGSKVAGGISSIHFDTLGVGFYSGKKNIIHFGQGLSHADIYTVSVPEPESYALMLAGLAAVGFVARRRSR